MKKTKKKESYLTKLKESFTSKNFLNSLLFDAILIAIILILVILLSQLMNFVAVKGAELLPVDIDNIEALTASQINQVSKLVSMYLTYTIGSMLLVFLSFVITRYFLYTKITKQERSKKDFFKYLLLVIASTIAIVFFTLVFQLALFILAVPIVEYAFVRISVILLFLVYGLTIPILCIKLAENFFKEKKIKDVITKTLNILLEKEMWITILTVFLGLIAINIIGYLFVLIGSLVFMQLFSIVLLIYISWFRTIVMQKIK